LGLIQDIWNSLTRKGVELKITQQDKLAWTIIKKDIKLKKLEKMYNGYHIRYKYRFLKPLLLIAAKLFIKTNKIALAESNIPIKDIDKTKYNKIINIWNDTLDQSCRESRLILKKDLKGYEKPELAAETRFAKSTNEIFMQTIMYDTYYRGMFEIFAVNLAKNMGEAFKDDKTHVLYNKKFLDDLDFLMATQRNDGNHIVMQDGNSFIVVKKGDAIRITNSEIEATLKDLREKEKKGELPNIIY